MTSNTTKHVYHLADDSNISTMRKSPRRKSSRTTPSNADAYSPSRGHGTLGTISPHSKPVLPPPPGLKNVGNTCYANAALQCLLSTALPHALLDERNAQIIRKHSFNRKLLVYGSVSADSESTTSRDDDADSAYGSCLTDMSSILYREDRHAISKALDDEISYEVGCPVQKSVRSTRKKWSKRSRDEASVFSQSTVHSEMYKIVNKRLDDWVLEDFLDTRKIQFPRKDGTQAGTGLSTPKKLGASGTTGSSRPSSPLAASSASDLTVNGSALLAAALQKRNGRKRKIGSVGKEETTSLAALPPAKKIISII